MQSVIIAEFFKNKLKFKNFYSFFQILLKFFSLISVIFGKILVFA